MNHHQYYLNTTSIYLMSTENHMLNIGKQDLAYFFIVRIEFEFTDVHAVSLEIAGGTRWASVYDWKGAGRYIFDYTCYNPHQMKVRLI